MSRFLRLLAAGSLAAALLAGCAGTQQGDYADDDTVGGPAAASRPDGRRPFHDPLIDAPYRAMMTCTSETPVTVLRRVKETTFACPDLGVSATIDEIRDAGWRMLSLDIGSDVESDDHVGFPVTIVVRKLF